MKRKFLTGLTLGLTVLMISVPVYADEDSLGELNVVYDEEVPSPASEEAAQDNSETDNGDSENEASDTEANGKKESTADAITSPEYVNTEADGADPINALNTAYSDDSSCQVNAKGVVPDGFGLNFYINIKNMDTGKLYQLPLYKENHYSQRCFVPQGSYTVTDVAVFEDTTGRYSFTYPDDFNVKENDVYSIEVTLDNYDEVDREIKEKKKAVLGEDAVYDDSVAKEVSEVTKPKVNSRFDVAYDGNGFGVIGITGTQLAEYDIRISIVTGGLPGETAVKISTDKGLSWSAEKTVPLDGILKLSGTGLTAEFVVDDDDKTGFIADDIYSCYVPDPKTELILEQKGGGSSMELLTEDPNRHPFNVLEDNKIDLMIKVRKSGGVGTAVIQISLNGGKSYGEQMLLSEDGKIKLTEYGLICDFTDKDGNTSKVSLEKNASYSAKAVRKSMKNVIYLLVAMGVIVIGFCIYGYIKLMSYMPKKSQYRINTYVPYSNGLKKRG